MPVPSRASGPETASLLKACRERAARLLTKREPWLQFTTQVAEHIMPSRLPYLLDPHGTQRAGEWNDKQVDAIGHLSIATTASAIFANAMPASSAWFGMRVRDRFAQDDEGRGFLEEVAARLLSLHNSSNANHVLPEPMREFVAFGQGAAMIVEDDVDDWRFEPFTVGEYCIEEDHRGRVDTCYRRMTMTVGQLVQEFGLDALSPSSRAEAELGNWDTVVPVWHAIEPDRDGRNPNPSKELPWRSVYWEDAGDCDQTLAVRGFEAFPVFVWRWGKLSGSAYAYGLGHDALPHLVQLRQMIYRYGQAMALKTVPAFQLPAGLQAHEVKALSGQSTKLFGPGSKVEPLFRVQDLELSELAQDIERKRQEIREVLGATIVAGLRRIHHQMTRGEAELRKSEDLVEFLPAVFRMNEELLNPYVEWMWAIARRLGRLPDLPDSLDEQIIDIEQISPLARRQRQGELDAIVRTFAVGAELAKVDPSVLDHLDAGAAIRRIAEIEGAPVAVLAPIEQVAQLQQARAQRAQAQGVAAAAQQGIEMAQGLAAVRAPEGAAA